MKIVHICLAGSYNDNWGYQENIIPKYHKFSGHDVTIITSVFVNSTHSMGYKRVKEGEYLLGNGIKIIRIPFKFKYLPVRKIVEKIRIYIGLYDALENEKPDFIFIHGLQFLDIYKVTKYLRKNKDIKVVVDNHSDFSNSAKNLISKNILHKFLWRRCAHEINPFTQKFYGVLPARVDFLMNVYKVPKEKVELLVMGADDEAVAEAIKGNVKTLIREKYNVKPDDFLIISGGKIDNNKLETLQLMEAVKNIKNERIKLIIFGSIIPELKEEFDQLLCESIKFIGWIDASETYKYFNAADLVVFPGLHSVFWEQVVGLGKPCVFKHIEGFTHVDLGGNCKFLHKNSIEEIKEVISEIVNNKDLYAQMENVAINKGMDAFSYKKIALKSIMD